MDIHSYIASGILESYAQGAVTDQERREVECLSKIYPEIQEALIAVEVDMEQFARIYSKKVPQPLKEKVLAKVAEHASTSSEQPNTSGNEKELGARVIQISQPESANAAHAKTNRIWIAAAAVMFGIATWQGVNYFSARQDLQKIMKERVILSEEVSNLRTQLDDVSSNMVDAFDPESKKVVLNSTQEGEKYELALFWNESSGQVRIDPSALPHLPDDLQYQLWVLLDGVPIDMGVLPKDARNVLMAEGLTKAGQAFAITIEPLGGRSSPTLEQLVVIGYVS